MQIQVRHKSNYYMNGQMPMKEKRVGLHWGQANLQGYFFWFKSLLGFGSAICSETPSHYVKVANVCRSLSFKCHIYPCHYWGYLEDYFSQLLFFLIYLLSIWQLENSCPIPLIPWILNQINSVKIFLTSAHICSIMIYNSH